MSWARTKRAPRPGEAAGCIAAPPGPFILLAAQRTGSTWAQEMLNSHPELKVYSELFLSYAQGRPMWEPADIEFANTFIRSRATGSRRLERHRLTISYLQTVFHQSDPRAIGFKLMYNQLAANPAIAIYAACARPRVVHLVRRNLLDTLISRHLAEASGVFHIHTDGRQQIPWLSTRAQEIKLRLDPQETLMQLNRLSQQRRLVRAGLRCLRLRFLEVVYEDLAQDPRRFERVLRFLGVNGQGGSIGSGLRKVNMRRQADVVENIDELRVALSSTPYACMLER